MNEANRIAAWFRRAKETWALQRSDLLPRMRAGERTMRAILWKEMSTADLRLDKAVSATEAVETVLFHYSEDGERWEVTADDFWSVIDDGAT